MGCVRSAGYVRTKTRRRAAARLLRWRAGGPTIFSKWRCVTVTQVAPALAYGALWAAHYLVNRQGQVCRCIGRSSKSL